jgi:uncharacterized protein
MMPNTLPFDTVKLIELCRKNDVTKLGVFGSMSRADATDASDIDLLVYFSKRKSLIAHAALQRQMSEALGRKVDLVTEAALSPYLRKDILNQVRVLYET